MRMSDLEQVLLSELLQWYRLQRHDFLNHWQVIMGNIQLNQPDKALAYMRGMITEPEQEQKIGQIPLSQLAAIMLGFIIRLRRADIMAVLSFPEDMRREDFWQDHWREEYGEGLYGYTRECLEMSAQFNKRELEAEVILYDEPGGFSCQYILLAEEDVLLDKRAKFGVEP